MTSRFTRDRSLPPSEMDLIYQRELSKKVVEILIEKDGTSEGAKLGWEHRDRGKGGKEEKTSPRNKDDDIRNSLLKYNHIQTELDNLPVTISEVNNEIFMTTVKPGQGVPLEDRGKLMKKIERLQAQRDKESKKVVDYCSNEIRSIVPGINVHFEEIHPFHAFHITEQIRKLNNDFPNYMKSLKSIYSNSIEAGAWAQYSPERQEITLSQYDLSARNATNLFKDQAMCVETKFHPPGCDNADSIFTHEFGHHIYYTQLTRLKDKKLSELLDEPHDRADWKMVELEKELSNFPVSEYAKKSLSECFAESFTSCYYTPDNLQTSSVKDMKELLKDPYWKTEGGK